MSTEIPVLRDTVAAATVEVGRVLDVDGSVPTAEAASYGVTYTKAAKIRALIYPAFGAA